MKKMTKQWVRKAEDDWAMANESSHSKTPLHDGVCFHCQQCAEKYLKALMEEIGLTIPKTHDLDRLFDELIMHHRTLGLLRRGLAFLTNFAVAVRYPGDRAKKRQAVAALRWAERVRAACRLLLGMSPRAH